MAYDEGLAWRIHEHFDDEPGITDKKMFGGLCFLHRGNMVAGCVGDELMVRVGAEAYADALARPHAREMDFTGRALKGMVYVGEKGFAEDADLAGWLELGLRHASSLPPKQAKSAGPRRPPATKKAAAKKKKKAAAKRKSAAKKTQKKKKAPAKPKAAAKKKKAAATKKKAAAKRAVRKSGPARRGSDR